MANLIEKNNELIVYNNRLILKRPIGPHSFATDSWAIIAAAIKSGNDPYKLGDTKTDTITIGSNSYTVTFKIVDNKVGRYKTQSGISHKVIEIQSLLHNVSGQTSAFDWKSEVVAGQGYPYAESDLATNIMDRVIYNFLPKSLKAVLETTTVYSGPGDVAATADNLVATTNKLFCASASEYYGAVVSGFGNMYETIRNNVQYGQYKYYEEIGVTKFKPEALIKYKVEDSVAAYRYWLRSPYSIETLFSISTMVGTVYASGGQAGMNIKHVTSRIAPCFSW